MTMNLKFVNIFISDSVGGLDGAQELKPDDIEKEMAMEELAFTRKINGTILNASLFVVTMVLFVSSLSVGVAYKDSLCWLDPAKQNRFTTLQYFLYYDAILLGVGILLIILTITLTLKKYPLLGVKFAIGNSFLIIVGLVAIQLAQFVVSKSFFVPSSISCALPMMTMTIVMNLSFFGGPLLLLCCFGISKGDWGPEAAQEQEDQEGQNVELVGVAEHD